MLFQLRQSHEFNFKIHPVVTEFDPPPPPAPGKEILPYYPRDEKHRWLNLKFSYIMFGKLGDLRLSKWQEHY
jgi:hypothetical protein